MTVCHKVENRGVRLCSPSDPQDRPSPEPPRIKQRHFIRCRFLIQDFGILRSNSTLLLSHPHTSSSRSMAVRRMWRTCPDPKCYQDGNGLYRTVTNLIGYGFIFDK